MERTVSAGFLWMASSTALNDEADSAILMVVKQDTLSNPVATRADTCDGCLRNFLFPTLHRLDYQANLPVT